MANIPLYGLLRYLSGRESAYNAGDTVDSGLIPGSRRSPGEGKGNRVQYSFLENPMEEDPGGLTKSSHRFTESDMTEVT